MAPRTLRGRLTTVNVLMITFGQLVSYLINIAFAKTDEGWRYMFGIAAAPALIQLLSKFIIICTYWMAFTCMLTFEFPQSYPFCLRVLVNWLRKEGQIKQRLLWLKSMERAYPNHLFNQSYWISNRASRSQSVVPIVSSSNPIIESLSLFVSCLIQYLCSYLKSSSSHCKIHSSLRFASRSATFWIQLCHVLCCNHLAYGWFQIQLIIDLLLYCRFSYQLFVYIGCTIHHWQGWSTPNSYLQHDCYDHRFVRTWRRFCRSARLYDCQR